MYQDKIEEPLSFIEYSKINSSGFSIHLKADMLPLTFVPHEAVCGQANEAKNLLLTRTNEEIIKISLAINYMTSIGCNTVGSLSQYFVDSKYGRLLTLTHSKALYKLKNHFDLSSLEINNLQWSEVFAVQALTNVAHYTFLSLKDFIKEFGDKPLDDSRLHVMQDYLIQLADSLSRAECLMDMQTKAKNTSSHGGKAKASNIEPLKQMVIRQYSKRFTSMSNRSAGKAIFELLDKEDNKLLFLSYADDKAHQFSKWIAQFLKGDLKITF